MEFVLNNNPHEQHPTSISFSVNYVNKNKNSLWHTLNPLFHRQFSSLRLLLISLQQQQQVFILQHAPHPIMIHALLDTFCFFLCSRSRLPRVLCCVLQSRTSVPAIVGPCVFSLPQRVLGSVIGFRSTCWSVGFCTKQAGNILDLSLFSA